MHIFYETSQITQGIHCLITIRKKNLLNGNLLYDSEGTQTRVLEQPNGVGRGGRWERGSRGRRCIYLWLIHIDVWQKAIQYCKPIILQLKINEFQKIKIKQKPNKQENKKLVTPLKVRG